MYHQKVKHVLHVLKDKCNTYTVYIYIHCMEMQCVTCVITTCTCVHCTCLPSFRLLVYNTSSVHTCTCMVHLIVYLPVSWRLADVTLYTSTYMYIAILLYLHVRQYNISVYHSVERYKLNCYIHVQCHVYICSTLYLVPSNFCEWSRQH